MKKIYILLLVIILLLVPTMVYADSEIPLPDDGYQYYVVYSISGNIFMVKTKLPAIVIKEGSSYYDYADIMTSPDGTLTRRYKLENNSWKYQSNFQVQSVPFSEILASNYNIVYREDHPKFGQVFFSPPKVSHLVNGVKKADSGMILKTISHGLILVSGCLISAICFRKAWAFLHNQLQH